MFEEIKNLYRKYPERCCITLVILAAVLPFLPALSFGTFIFDDSAYIGQEFLFSLSWRNLKYHLTSETVGLHSPLVMLSFIPDYLLWGKELFHGGARLQNILWHAVSMVLFYLILRKLKWNFNDGDELDIPPLAAMFAAVAAALHPQRIESVVWLAERKDVLVVTLGLAATYAFITAYQRNRIPLAAPVLLFISMWGVKPMMITLPLILTAGFIAAEKGFCFRRSVRYLSGMYLAALLYVLMNFSKLFKFSAGAVSGVSGSSGESRIAIAAYNILLYFGKTLCPVKLNPLYPLFDPEAISNWYVVFVLLIIAGVTAPAVIRWDKREKWARTLLPCALMFGMAVFPVCNLQRIGNVDFADRYSYFPSLFIWAAVAAAAVLIWRNFMQHRRITGIVSAFYLLTLLGITISYLPAWKDHTSQTDAMLDTPEPHSAALKIAAYDEYVKKDYDKCLTLVDWIASRENLNHADEIFIQGMIGMIEIDRGHTAQGIARINGFLSQPDWYFIRGLPGRFIRNCMLTAATWHLKQRKPENLRYAANIFLMWSQLAADSNQMEKYNYQGVAMMISGRYDEAEKYFSEALAFAPDDANVRKNLESARRKKSGNNLPPEPLKRAR